MGEKKHPIFLPGLDLEIESQASSLDDEIAQLSDKATLNGIPVVEQLLHFSSDPKEITRLAKALYLIAKKLPDKNLIEKKLAVLQLAKENPEWFQMAFIDEDAIDKGILELCASADKRDLDEI